MKTEIRWYHGRRDTLAQASIPVVISLQAVVLWILLR